MQKTYTNDEIKNLIKTDLTYDEGIFFQSLLDGLIKLRDINQNRYTCIELETKCNPEFKELEDQVKALDLFSYINYLINSIINKIIKNNPMNYENFQQFFKNISQMFSLIRAYEEGRNTLL